MSKFFNKEFFYLALLSFGINLCFAFQLTNLSSIFKFLGAHNSELPLLWLIPPLTGLIIQPLIGQISDDTASRYGKRRPYIFVFGTLAALSFLSLTFVNSLFMALFLTWLIDCSLNGSAEGLRALTGDRISNEHARSQAFALQALASGIGGVLGAALPYVLFRIYNLIFSSPLLSAGEVPINLKISFIVASGLLIASIYLGLKQIPEKTYKHNELFQKRKKPINIFSKIKKTMTDLYNSFRKMPSRFKQICLIHGLTWSGIFIFWLYFTVTIAQNLYGLPVHANTSGNLEHAALLQQATLDTSIYFSIYQYVSLAFAVLLYFFSQHSRIIAWHATALVVGAIGIAATSIASNSYLLIFGCAAFGIMWGSMLVLPYTIALKLLPKGKIGTYLGIFNISITAPQIICGLLLVPIYSYVFKGHAAYLLMIASFLIFISAILWKRLEPSYSASSIKLFSGEKESLSMNR